MALLQNFPAFELSQSAYSGEKALPCVRRPKEVAFRSGGDLTEAVQAIVVGGSISLDAAPGAGKTTVLPAAVAKAVDCLVVHVFPTEQLAAAQHRYAGRGGDVAVKLVLSVGDAWPEKGWVMTSAGCVVAKWLAAGALSMPPCVVLHDESHDSGAASALVRALWAECAGVRSYVSMTATSGPTGARKMETKGEVVDRLYEPGAFSDPWEVEETGAPWSVAEMSGDCLIFEDDRQRAGELLQAFNYNGALAYRLDSRSPVGEVLRVLDEFGAGGARVRVLVADSTYRSGYTFPVSTVVDSGRVVRVVVNGEGKPAYLSRPLYEAEVVQSRARGGRMPGQRTEYWRPAVVAEKRICDLGQCDIEAFALVCRALGYRVPAWAAGATMAKGRVPRDLSRALSGKTPLGCMVPGQLCPVAECARKVTETPPAAVAAAVEAPRVARVAEAGPALGVGVANAGQSSGGADAAFGMTEAFDAVRARLAPAVGSGRVEVGQYYFAEGLTTGHSACVALPDGVQSVLRAVASGGYEATLVWPEYVRAVAINAVMHAYNTSVLQSRAVAGALRAVRADTTRREGRALRVWATGCAETLSQAVSAGEYYLDLLVRLSGEACTLVPCGDIYGEEEAALAGDYRDSYYSVPAVAVGDRAQEVERVRAWAGEASRALAPASRSLGRQLAGGAVAGQAELPPVVRMFTGRREDLRVVYDRKGRLALSRPRSGSSAGASSSTRSSESGSGGGGVGARVASAPGVVRAPAEPPGARRYADTSGPPLGGRAVPSFGEVFGAASSGLPFGG